MPRRWSMRVTVVALLAVVAAMAGEGHAQAGDAVRLQLKWLTQAHFAGYYAARAKGFYAAENLSVTIQPGGPSIVPEQVVAAGGAHLGIHSPPRAVPVT